jgi:hypothetical protein
MKLHGVVAWHLSDLTSYILFTHPQIALRPHYTMTLTVSINQTKGIGDLAPAPCVEFLSRAVTLCFTWFQPHSVAFQAQTKATV